MSHESTPSAKSRVLEWVRSKNPQTMEPKELCRYEWSNLDGAAGGGFIQSKKHWDAIQSHPKIDEVKILGSDMGLQEFVIALRGTGALLKMNGELFQSSQRIKPLCTYDLTKNLHEQSDDFYEALLPLIPNAS